MTKTPFLYAIRLSWRQLVFERGKLFAAILGVMFAAILVFMQMGFRDSLMESAANSPRLINGDLFLLHKQTEAMWRTVVFDRTELMRALANKNVEKVTPFYIAMGPFKNPKTLNKRTLMMMGFEPNSGIFAPDMVAPYVEKLQLADNILFDMASHPNFGPVPEMLKNGSVTTELNDRSAKVVGLFKLGASFGSDGNAITSDSNFFRFFPNRNPSFVDIGVIKLRDGSDAKKVKEELLPLLNKNVYLFTYQELIDFEKSYWQNTAPIGFIFGFGMIMGLVVGMVIVYQILFTDITNHINEYATLKAMGYSNSYFVMVVFAASFFLALLGFLPGLAVSSILYNLTENVTFIPMPMTFIKIVNVFIMILSMCFFAGLLAIRKLRSANPADLF